MPPVQLRNTSASQYTSWVACNRKWYMSSVMKVPWITGPAQTRGKDIHAEIEHYLRYGEIRDTEWAPYVRAALPHLPAYDPRAAALNPGGSDGQSYAVEHGFWLPTVGGLPWIGWVDLEIYDTHGGPALQVIVRDYKTTSNFRYNKTEEELRKDPQLCCYAHNYFVKHPEYQGDIEVGHIYLLTKNKTPKAEYVNAMVSRQRAADQWAVSMQSVSEMLAVDVEDFEELPPNTASCGMYGGCQFRANCGLIPTQKTIAQTEEDKAMAEMTFLEKLKATNGIGGAAPVTTTSVAQTSGPTDAAFDAEVAKLTAMGLPQEMAVAAATKTLGARPVNGTVNGVPAAAASGVIVDAAGAALAVAMNAKVAELVKMGVPPEMAVDLAKKALASGPAAPVTSSPAVPVTSSPAAPVTSSPAAPVTGILPPDAASRFTVDIREASPPKTSKPEADDGDDAEETAPVTGAPPDAAPKKRGRPRTKNVAPNTVHCSCGSVMAKFGESESYQHMTVGAAGGDCKSAGLVLSKTVALACEELWQAQEKVQGMRDGTTSAADAATAVAKAAVAMAENATNAKDAAEAALVVEKAKSVEAAVKAAEVAAAESHAILRAKSDTTTTTRRALTLYIDCFPEKRFKGEDEPTELTDWIAPSLEKVAKENDVAEWVMVKYMQMAEGLLASAVRARIAAGDLPEALVVRTGSRASDVALEVLIPHSTRRVRGVRA